MTAGTHLKITNLTIHLLQKLLRKKKDQSRIENYLKYSNQEWQNQNAQMVHKKMSIKI